MNNDQFSSFSSLWRNLKRALVSTPPVQNESNTPQQSGMEIMNIRNFSNNCDGSEPTIVTDRSLENNIEFSSKRKRLDIVTDRIGSNEEVTFMEIMKNLLSCSICLEVNNYSNQCPNGHLICVTCCGRLQQTPSDLNCPVCRVSLKRGLHRSLLAEQLTSELPANCKYCDNIMPVKFITKHETEECNKRMVSCKYKMFGCNWIDIQENIDTHIEACPISNKTIGILHDIVDENITKDMQLLQFPLQLWRSIMSRIKVQSAGSRLLMRQTTLVKSLGEDIGQLLFKSSMIPVPFSCCNLHGFYIDIFVIKENESDNEKLYYTLKSENQTKLTLYFYLANVKLNENLNLEVQDSLHSHHFESNHKDSLMHEFKLLMSDSEKHIPKLFSLENIGVEICFISERERSERSHGILSSNDDDEYNPFSSNGSDSNVLFTLFSPTSNSTRSMNTSNTVVTGNDEANLNNEIEPTQEDDIIITVTDNIIVRDDFADNTENFPMRNNHSFVSVPNVLVNQTTPALTYTPFQIDTSFTNNIFQQNTRFTRNNVHHQQQQMVSDNLNILGNESDIFSSHIGSLNRNSNTGPNDQFIREPINRSVVYPQQAIMAPYISNPMSSLILYPTVNSNNPILVSLQNQNPFTFQLINEQFSVSDNANISQNVNENNISVPINNNFPNEDISIQIRPNSRSI